MSLFSSAIYTVIKFLRKHGYTFGDPQDARVLAMKKMIGEIGKVEFKIEHYPDGTWTAESVNIDGIITGGDSVKQMPEMIRDAVFTYFGIPPHLCDDALLKSDNEPVTMTQRVYV